MVNHFTMLSMMRHQESASGRDGREQIAEALQEIVEATNGRCYRKGDVIYQPGDLDDRVYYVADGKVKLAYLDESGRKLTLALLGQGEIFGEMVLLGSRRREHLAQALQDAVIHPLERSRFLYLLERKPWLALEIIQLFGKRARDLEQKLEDLVFKDITTRLSRQLLRLIADHGQETPEGRQISFKITHKELADMIGSARENTTSALNRLAREGILEKKRYYIIVKDEERLKEKSGSV